MQVFRNPGHIFQDIESRLARSMGRVKSGLSPCKVRVSNAISFYLPSSSPRSVFFYIYNTRSAAAILAAHLRRPKEKSHCILNTKQSYQNSRIGQLVIGNWRCPRRARGGPFRARSGTCGHFARNTKAVCPMFDHEFIQLDR